MKFLLPLLLVACSLDGYRWQPMVLLTYGESDVTTSTGSSASGEGMGAQVGAALVPTRRDVYFPQGYLRYPDAGPPRFQEPKAHETKPRTGLEKAKDAGSSFDGYKLGTQICLTIAACWLGWIYRKGITRIITLGRVNGK